jgi:hypothetical protein
LTVAGNEAVKRAEYSSLGRVTEFNYGSYLGQAFSGIFPTNHLYNFGKLQGFLQHLTGAQHINKSPAVMQPESSLLFSQKSTSKPAESDP